MEVREAPLLNWLVIFASESLENLRMRYFPPSYTIISKFMKGMLQGKWLWNHLVPIRSNHVRQRRQRSTSRHQSKHMSTTVKSRTSLSISVRVIECSGSLAAFPVSLKCKLVPKGRWQYGVICPVLYWCYAMSKEESKYLCCLPQRVFWHVLFSFKCPIQSSIILYRI